MFGLLVCIGFIDHWATTVTWLAPTAEGLTGTEKLVAQAPRQIANAHTIFNVTNTFIFIGFTGVFAGFVKKQMPDEPTKQGVIVRVKYLENIGDIIETSSRNGNEFTMAPSGWPTLWRRCSCRPK